MEFICQTCGAHFTTSKSLQRHIRAQHLNEKHLCIYCHKPFMYVSAKTRHEKNNCPANKYHDSPQTTNEPQVQSAKRKYCTTWWNGKKWRSTHFRFLLLHHIASDGKTIDLRWPPISQHCARSKKTINISSATDQIL